MEIDHIIPESHGGRTERENLWLACSLCNGHKSDRMAAIDPDSGEWVRLYNPRYDTWNNHFCWNDACDHIVGHSSIGRAAVIALNLNRLSLVKARQLWVAVGWHPPT